MVFLKLKFLTSLIAIAIIIGIGNEKHNVIIVDASVFRMTIRKSPLVKKYLNHSNPTNSL
ncbi:hypothetical protein D3C76_1510520 [compost metagenome]